MAKQDSFHENLRQAKPADGSSNRGFGFVMAGALAIIGALPLIGGNWPIWWLYPPAAAFLATALVKPDLLAPLNALWTRFGLLLHRIVNPIMLGIMFFGVVVPTGLLMRLFRRDPLRLRFDRDAATYWIKRTPPGPDPTSMSDQF